MVMIIINNGGTSEVRFDKPSKQHFPDGTVIKCVDEENYGELATVHYANSTLGVLAKLNNKDGWIYYFVNDIKAITIMGLLREV